MNILGINGSPNLIHENMDGFHEGINHDSAAVLLRDGQIIAAFEEERLNRIKHTNKWPVNAVRSCLDHADLDIDQIDYISFSASEEEVNEWLKSVSSPKRWKSLNARQFAQELLQDQFGVKIDKNKFEFFEHHYAHAVTAYYPSNYNEALVLTIDGAGTNCSGTVYEGRVGELKPLQMYTIEQSLGHFYESITQTLGFASQFDEYKVMGLAPYGNPKTFRAGFEKMFELLEKGNYSINWNEIRLFCKTWKFTKNKDSFAQEQMDIAASLQEALETIVYHILRYFKKLTGHSNLCMAGGVALNCTLNGKLLSSGMFDDVFVYPAANDSGLPVGSALATYFEKCDNPKRAPMHSMYLGAGLGDLSAIEDSLDNWRGLISYGFVDDIAKKAAELLAGDKVLGWVQGQSEFAPRALGNRSILADSRPAINKKRINSMVKKREGFRPFAPSVLEEHVSDYFELPTARTEFSHMTFTFKVKEKYQEHLGAITHVDGSSRVQTVSRHHNPKYWQLIEEFRELTGTPVILNTSFNNNVEPIVNSVTDAIVCFLTTNIDYLIVEDFLISKQEISANKLETLYPSLAPYIVLKNIGFNSFEVGNTFSNKIVAVSKELYGLLSQSSGNKSLADILDQHAYDQPTKNSIIDEVMELWGKRLIILDPLISNVVTKENELASLSK